MMAALFLFPSSTLVPGTLSTSPQYPKGPKPFFPTLTSTKPKISALCSPRLLSSVSPTPSCSRRRRNGGNSRKDFRVRADDDDDLDSTSPDDYDVDIEEAEEFDNKDYDVEYDRLLPSPPTELEESAGGDDIEMVQSKSFVSTRGWDSETVVDYKINEDEFHKISLLDCDFFIRKPPDPDSDVYDFREMYVTPPDTDVYAIPKVLAPMPEKYIRCSKSDYGRYNVTEPPIDAPRDPLYKSVKEIFKVFLIKHYRNRRAEDRDFFLDFEEIYVIDSKARSITRARVVVTVPEGKNRDRTKDILTVRDNGSSFKIIPDDERDDPDTVIEKEDWIRTRREMEKHLRKLRDFSISNWF